MDTKKLRQKILDLAIRGKLVPQDPNDEPASVLLERIRVEKERLIIEGKIKRSKKSVSDTHDIPFEVPKGWEWCVIDDIAFVTKLAGFEYTNYIADNLSKTTGVPLFKGKNVQDGKIIYEFESYIPKSISDALPRSQVNKRCLLTPYVGTIGNIGIHDKKGDFHLGSNVGKIELFNEVELNVCEEYIRYFLMSYAGYKELTKHKKATAQDSISIDAIRDVRIPLPPINEQKRIIQEIDYWLSQVKTIEDSENDINNLIDQAKSKILDLAIHGKLVPQDPNDEPAIDLLKRINPKFEPCENEDCSFIVPTNWCWSTLANVCEIITGSTPSKAHPEYYGGDFPFYKPSDLDAGRHVTMPSEYLTEAGRDVSRIISKNSTAICCIGSIGKSGYIEREGTTNQQINTAIPSEGLYPLYLYYFCNSTFFVDNLSADSSAITIAIVNKSKLAKMLISVPPYQEQLRIVAKIEELFAVLDSIKQSL